MSNDPVFRLLLLTGVIVAFVAIVSGVAGVFSADRVPVRQLPVQHTVVHVETASSTIVTASDSANAPVSPSVSAQSMPKKPAEVTTVAAPAPAPTPAAKPATQQSPEAPSNPELAYFSIDSLQRDAVVNIYCSDGDNVPISSGSGVIVDPRGIILTNAHVATDFLFTEWPNPSLRNCVVRTGSPAYPMYRASLLFIPDAFVRTNVSTLFVPDDVGYVYGKDDYALLVITGRTNPAAQLPDPFPYMRLSVAPQLPKNSPAYIIGYPAGLLGGITTLRDLYMITSPAIVRSVKSFLNNGQADVLSFNGTIAGQHGASGGAIIESDLRMAGMPTFFDSNQGTTTADATLNAITVRYIDGAIKDETGLSLGEYIARPDPISLSKQFMSQYGSVYQTLYAHAWKDHLGIILPGVTY